MSLTPDAIYDAAVQLPEDERFALVTRLLETMPAASLTVAVDDPLLAEELDRRFADNEGSVRWSDLRAEQ